MNNSSLKTHFSPDPLPYTGHELRPHFLLSRFGLRGSALAAFRGPCKVQTAELVDWEDRLADDRFEAAEMIHFLGEFFGIGLREGVLIQRLLMAILAEQIQSLLKEPKVPLRREGDDLWVNARKLSVSIATVSPVSALIHAGINIDASGAPVPAVGLIELGIDPNGLSDRVLEAFAREWEDLSWACAKVRSVI